MRKFLHRLLELARLISQESAPAPHAEPVHRRMRCSNSRGWVKMQFSDR